MSANLESVVDTVEEEIRRAEALLAHDIMHVGDDWSPSGRQVPAQPRIQESRRREVLDGLRAERDGTANSNSNNNNNGSESSSDSGAERRQQRQREDAAVPPATPSANTLNSSVGMTAPTPGGTERDVLIARLLAEREAKLKNEQFQKQRQQQQQANTPANASSHRGAAGSSNPPATSASVKVTRKGSVVITQQQMPPRAPVAGSAADPYLQHPTMPYFPPPENAAPMARPTDPVPRPAPSLTPSSSATPNLSLSQLHPAAAAEGDAASSYQHGSASSATASASASPAQSPMRWAESTRSKRFSRRTKDDVRREAEEKRKDECTFKPKINSRSRASAKTNTETRRQRFRRLSSTHEAREKHLAAARAKAEAEHMAECTFKPKINKRSSTGDARQAQAGAGVSVSRKQNLPDRLHHEADKRAIARQKMRRHLEKQVSSFQCGWSPCRNPITHTLQQIYPPHPHPRPRRSSSRSRSNHPSTSALRRSWTCRTTSRFTNE